MPRFYVKNKENKWNIFSTIVDDFLYVNWQSFDDLVETVCSELLQNKYEEMQTLLTDKPKLNIMSYDEAMRIVGGMEKIPIKDYEKHHQNGGYYMIPVEVFNDWLDEFAKLKCEKKELIKWLKRMLDDEDDIFSVVRVKDVLYKVKGDSSE